MLSGRMRRGAMIEGQNRWKRILFGVGISMGLAAILAVSAIYLPENIVLLEILLFIALGALLQMIGRKRTR
jgi:uncharacterized membrane protein